MPKRAKRSAGLLMYRQKTGELEVFLVHPGGPLWANKDEGVWSLPKGQYDAPEEPLAAAQREFAEETGFASQAPFLALGEVQQKSGKVVCAWAFEGDCNPAELVSNTCELQWPPRSGKTLVIPEIDRGAWFSVPAAHVFLREEQRTFLLRLMSRLAEAT
jgi:predicted NUDIX family NTP pyrophosphohydrolase